MIFINSYILAVFLLFAANALQAMVPQHQLAVALCAFGAVVAMFVIPHLIGVLESLKTRVLRLELIDNVKVALEQEAARAASQAAKAARKAARKAAARHADEDIIRGLVASLLPAQAVGVAPVAVPAPAPAPVPAPAPAQNAVHPR